MYVIQLYNTIKWARAQRFKFPMKTIENCNKNLLKMLNEK